MPQALPDNGLPALSVVGQKSDPGPSALDPPPPDEAYRPAGLAPGLAPAAMTLSPRSSCLPYLTTRREGRGRETIALKTCLWAARASRDVGGLSPASPWRRIVGRLAAVDAAALAWASLALLAWLRATGAVEQGRFRADYSLLALWARAVDCGDCFFQKLGAQGRAFQRMGPSLGRALHLWLGETANRLAVACRDGSVDLW